MNSLDLDKVSIALGGRTILSDVTIAIGAAEFIGVLGPNGAGKTTLMRAILGLVPVSQGRMAVLGEPVRRGHPGIGYMPQWRSTSPQLRLSGWNVVASAYRGENWGLPVLGRAGRAEIGRAIELVRGEALARRPLGELSGGERQRLLLAQALLGRPRLLLLDEPLMSLDVNHQRGVVELVREVQRELKIAVLFTAHELNPLLGAMDRVLYLGNGRAALGTVDQVMTGPVLSKLYGTEIDVVRLGRRIFVMAGDHELDQDHHGHGHGSGHGLGHDHGHGHHHEH
ncbi:MAG TPA: ATP-binding cassette domain-containing protein [Stellaceae bacterium]|nr:ATP-binding cassette domain-containing protein [Stellaceae bacterium]